MNYAKVDEQGRLIRNIPEEERGRVYQLQSRARSPPSSAISGSCRRRPQRLLVMGRREKQEPAPK